MTTASHLLRSRADPSLWTTPVALLLACTGSNSTSKPSDAGADTGDASTACPTALPAGDGGACQGPAGVAASSEANAPDYLPRLGCLADFQMLASDPMDSTLPGARSVKIVLDTQHGNVLYFQNSSRYTIHYTFAASQKLTTLTSGDFENTQYTRPDRDFILGAVTYYEEPRVWAVEFAPYDTAPASMMEELFNAVKGAAYFGSSLFFHPTSVSIQAETSKFGPNVPVMTGDCLYNGIDYQPLNLANGIGTLRMIKVSDLDTTQISPFDVLVLDETPNDIPVVQGLITEQFQTPLSHINVLARNRCTPNMGLRRAMTNPKLLAHRDQLVRLIVGAEDWDVQDVTVDEANAYWAAKRPEQVILPQVDESVTGIFDIQDVTPDPLDKHDLYDAIQRSIKVFGGKAAQYSILAKTNMSGGILADGDTPVPTRKAFAVPAYYYAKFMRDNGFFARIRGWQTDPSFTMHADVRNQELLTLRNDMAAAALDPALMSLVMDKVNAEFPGLKIRFRTSTNSEDLAAFPCAGCYESHSGQAGNEKSIADAIRAAYASAWLYRTYEERSYYSVDHESVGMALLVHPTFVAETANGVAVTANPFDPDQIDAPAFYVNVQYGGDVEVVHPVSGISSETFLYYYMNSGTIVRQSHSSLLPSGQNVLTDEETHDLADALKAVHTRFSYAYGPAARVRNSGWYAMDVEFKFEDGLYLKQARPYPSGTESSTCNAISTDAGIRDAGIEDDQAPGWPQDAGTPSVDAAPKDADSSRDP